MQSRHQYLRVLRERYVKARAKKERTQNLCQAYNQVQAPNYLNFSAPTTYTDILGKGGAPSD